jgi:hypothetical protein
VNKEPEKWVDIVGYEGLYSISNLGRIASHHRDECRILHPTTHRTNRYSYVNLCRNGIAKLFRVHVLVAKHFLPNPNSLLEVNHKDEDKSNNRVDNLEWCSRQYNINYGTGRERQRVKMCKPVVQYSKTGTHIRSYDSISQASQIVGSSVSTIVNCCKQRKPSAGGFVWRYLTEVQSATK